MTTKRATLAKDQSSDSESETFYDCSNENGGKNIVLGRSTSSHNNRTLVQNGNFKDVERLDSSSKSVWGNRTRLPSTMITRADFSVWSFLKSCIGKDLSKITMPVSFNEPLSFLQRVVEYVEYSELLVQASQCDDPIMRHELVTAFAVSATASNWERTGKPFNPLLGETYELDRQDLGLRIVCEQVSHHPPVSAFHVESPMFTFHGCIHPKIKFWGPSIQVTPKGLVTLHLHSHKEVYTWQNINCSVRNIILGKVWIEHYGDMEVTNHVTKFKAMLQFKPCGWMSNDVHKVQGFLCDSHKTKVRAFYGKWIEAMYSVDMSVWNNYAQASGYRDIESPSRSKSDSESTAAAERGANCDLKLAGQKLLWAAKPKPSNTSQYYNFTSFAMMLNELDPRHADIPQTDCRLRPDMRIMEAGDAEGSSQQKARIEEKQRTARKERKKTGNEFKPRWFRPGYNRFTGAEEWLFTGQYWERNWDDVEDIF